MNTRGLVELIVLNIGLDLGVITPRLFTMLVIMALVTTMMTSPILTTLLTRPSHHERVRRRRSQNSDSCCLSTCADVESQHEPTPRSRTARWT